MVSELDSTSKHVFLYDSTGFLTEMLMIEYGDTIWHNKYKNDFVTDEFFILNDDTISRTYKTLIDRLNFRVVQVINSDSVVAYGVDLVGKHADFSISLDHKLNCLEKNHSYWLNESHGITVTYDCNGNVTQLIEEIFKEANIREKIRSENYLDSTGMVDDFIEDKRFSYGYDLIDKDTFYYNKTLLYREYY